MLDQRLIDLEIKISHQEQTIESLQACVYEQQKAIETLEISLQRLSKRLVGLVEAGPDIGPADDKPPHY